MSDIGTVTEIEPEDGLGWIEMENGDRVRFGGTSCKGFVPAIGMVVRVISTRPGYGGTVKATELAKISDAPKKLASRSDAAPQPRKSLHTIQQATSVRAEDLLLTVLGRADVDEKLHADLNAIGFSVAATPGLQIGCRNPWFYQVATDAEGNAYGLYAHAMYEGDAVQPWLLWNRGTGTLRFVAHDTAALWPTVLASASAPADVVARLRATLISLGMPDVAGAAHGGGEKVAWLPADPGELRSVDDYLGEADGGEMERGLLAHAFREGADPRAMDALRSLYVAWEWPLPPWVG